MRLMRFAHDGTPMGDVTGVVGAKHREVINGEDSLTIAAYGSFAKGERIVWRDGMERWREYVIARVTETHDAVGKPLSEVWAESSTCELRGDYVLDKRPGVNDPASATVGMTAALSASRWGVGTVDVAGLAGAMMYHVSAWDAVCAVVKAWGGELLATVTVDATGITGRSLSLLAHRGTTTPTRRFEWGADMRSISREVDESDVITAAYGWGKGEELEDGAYGRRLGIEDVTSDGLPYVHDDSLLATWGRPDGNHTFGEFVDAECEDADVLLAETQAYLAEHSQPRVSYKASVVQFALAGTDMGGVALGDEVDVVDRGFAPELRVQARVVALTEDLMEPSKTEVTLGNYVLTSATDAAQLSHAVASLTTRSAAWDAATGASAGYVESVIDRLNELFASSGGFVTIDDVTGITVMDAATQSAATKAIQINGAGFRIANSKTSSGDWDWRTFGTGDGFTADEIIAGIIKSASGESWWDLNTGAMQLSEGLTIKRNGVVQGSFGGGTVQIGESGKSHQELDYHSWQMVDKEGNVYANVSDLRDATGYATIVEAFVGTGTATAFTLSLNASPVSSVTVAGSAVTGWTLGTNRRTLTLASAPASGAAVVVTYQTSDPQAKAYTFGARASGNVGPRSFAQGTNAVASGNSSHAEGLNATASGNYAHAEGYNVTAGQSYAHAEGHGTTAGGSGSHAEGSSAVASGNYSHAEGYNTEASGDYSHAEGSGSTAAGTYSHAGGVGTIANGAGQTVVGKYNVADATSLLIVGSGTSSARSNAVSVASNGTVTLGRPLPVASGGTGGATAAAAADALAVGSLSPVTAIASGTSLNTLMTPGSYVCATDAVAATLVSCPTTQAFRLWVGKVLGASNAYLSQELLTYTGHRFYRVYANGAWVAWVSDIDSHGGTMTGAMTHKGASTSIKATNLTHSTAVSAATNGNSALQFRDSAGTLVGQLSARFRPGGEEGFNLYAVNGSTYHGLQLTVDGNGKRYVTLNEAAPWLDALGLNLVDFKSSVTMTETPLRSHFVKQGSVVHVFWQGAATTHASGATLFTLPSGYRPSQLIDTPFVVAGSAYGILEISTAGVCKVLHISSTTASGRIVANFTFPVA